MPAAWQGAHWALGRRLGLATLTGCVLGAPDVAVSQEGALNVGRGDPPLQPRLPNHRLQQGSRQRCFRDREIASLKTPLSSLFFFFCLHCHD